MAQEDKGLVIRGLLLLGLIGGLVAFVLTILFWRPEPTVAVDHRLDKMTPSAPGWEVRYNAATTLARRGSDAVPWELLREMLDEKQQMRNNMFRQPDGQYVVDEAAARVNMMSALKALTAWHEKQKAKDKMPEISAELRAIYGMVDKLTESPFVELKVQAEKAKSLFFRS